jgi:hypothetical protein
MHKICWADDVRGVPGKLDQLFGKREQEPRSCRLKFEIFEQRACKPKGTEMKRLLVTSLLVSAVIASVGSSALAQSRQLTRVGYMYCPSDSPRYGYVAYRNIKWCYAGPYGSLEWNPPGFNKSNNSKKAKAR